MDWQELNRARAQERYGSRTIAGYEVQGETAEQFYNRENTKTKTKSKH